MALCQEGGAFEVYFDELVALVLRDVGATLHSIYNVYFPHETRAVRGNSGMPDEEAWKATEKSLFQFLKEYDMCPALINKGIAFQLYLNTRN